jgi:hypothetical protein
MRRHLVFVGSLLVTVHPVTAQRWAEPGGRIRASPLSGSRVVGRVIRWAGDTLEVAEEKGGVWRFPVSKLQRIDISNGRSTAAIKGMVLGTATGVAIGGVIALLNPHGAGDLNRGQLLVAAAAGFGVVGLGSGFFLGAFFTVENWERAEIGPKLLVGNHSGSRLRLQVSVSF